MEMSEYSVDWKSIFRQEHGQKQQWRSCRSLVLRPFVSDTVEQPNNQFQVFMCYSESRGVLWISDGGNVTSYSCNSYVAHPIARLPAATKENQSILVPAGNFALLRVGGLETAIINEKCEEIWRGPFSHTFPAAAHQVAWVGSRVYLSLHTTLAKPPPLPTGLIDHTEYYEPELVELDIVGRECRTVTRIGKDTIRESIRFLSVSEKYILVHAGTAMIHLFDRRSHEQVWCVTLSPMYYPFSFLVLTDKFAFALYSKTLTVLSLQCGGVLSKPNLSGYAEEIIWDADTRSLVTTGTNSRVRRYIVAKDGSYMSEAIIAHVTPTSSLYHRTDIDTLISFSRRRVTVHVSEERVIQRTLSLLGSGHKSAVWTEDGRFIVMALSGSVFWLEPRL